MASASIEHISVDDQRVARIAGSRIKVIHLVMDKLAYGWSPEEIQSQFPHLSLADVHAAFAYYYDHREELDRQIEESLKFADEMRANSDQSRIVERLRSMGKLK